MNEFYQMNNGAVPLMYFTTTARENLFKSNNSKIINNFIT